MPTTDRHPLSVLAYQLTAGHAPHATGCPDDEECTCGVTRAVEMLRVLAASPAKLDLVTALVQMEEGSQDFKRLHAEQTDAVVAWLRGGKMGPKPDDEVWAARDDVRAARRKMDDAAQSLERYLRAWLGVSGPLS